MEFIIDLLATTIRVSTPLLFAALGGVISERSGVLNISLEGNMLMGAFFGMVVSFYTGSPWLGILGAALAGLLLSVIMAYMSISLRTDQIVAATAVNILALGITSFLIKLFNILQDTNTVITVPSFQNVRIPLLSQIPFLGPVLFQQKPLTYLAFLLVILLSVYLYKTKYGLIHRAVGEHPEASDTLGINVNKIRYYSVLACGFLSGVGGGYLSISQLNQFQDEMVAGKGFIAFAAVIFGRWNPVGAMLAALLFGLADAFQMRIQAHGVDVSYHLLQMLPYLLTMLALLGFIGKSRPPAANGKAYAKEE